MGPTRLETHPHEGRFIRHSQHGDVAHRSTPAHRRLDPTDVRRHRSIHDREIVTLNIVLTKPLRQNPIGTRRLGEADQATGFEVQAMDDAQRAALDRAAGMAGKAREFRDRGASLYLPAE